jgi:hypothetical protein
MKNVVNAVVKSCLFDRRDIRGLFHHANQPLVSCGAGAVAAWINICDVAAYRAKMKFFFKIADGRREILGVFSAGAQNMKCQTLGAFAANPWKFL